MVLSGMVPDSPSSERGMQAHVFGSKWSRQAIPKYELPAEEMPPSTAYQLIKDELELDGRPALNLASFVTTYMEPEAEKLMTESLNKNIINYEEYPITVELQNRCVNMLGRLFHAPLSADEAALGVSTVGSTIILSTLAMKRRWQLRREKEGKSKEKPNLVMGANVQVCWEKAVRYLEIEARYVFCTEDQMFMDPKQAAAMVDENTIGTVAILGSTYTGHYEDVKTLNDLLVEINKKTGWNVPIHVDAASGGFVAPFLAPDLVWDFRLPCVASINTSGHKYGLVYPGVGWCIWRSKDFLPDDLVFHVNYLGADQASFTLNFSKGSSQVIAQYYVMIRLGMNGFKSIMENLQETSIFLSHQIKSMGFEIMSSEDPSKGLPLVAFKLPKDASRHFDEFDVAGRLREKGWIVPAYTLAPHADKSKLLRVVIREDFSYNRAELLLADLQMTLDFLKKQDAKSMEARREAHKQYGAAHKHHKHHGLAVAIPEAPLKSIHNTSPVAAVTTVKPASSPTVTKPPTPAATPKAAAPTPAAVKAPTPVATSAATPVAAKAPAAVKVAAPAPFAAAKVVTPPASRPLSPTVSSKDAWDKASANDVMASAMLSPKRNPMLKKYQLI
ncbi:glutamate decarboxylase [Synchytrium microbalum]|uniref:Glutamate decarboxylase n=1 Tax=Synchytrium microbalum TaxID=1806994 RepID=A0A507C426_9FUNG|nr:glutamate decarboxylase [Synchytrium microbalum]TPX32864.1 glutamate decarboxylase [Synchytrium microbalum]